jgi:predicted regulator of amino acid metabolism with ACT domain
MKGILAGAAQAIARRGISIRQAVADDPDLHPEPKLTIITEKPIPGDIIPELLRIEGVNKVVVY